MQEHKGTAQHLGSSIRAERWGVEEEGKKWEMTYFNF
jgi:hypothetical protein